MKILGLFCDFCSVLKKLRGGAPGRQQPESEPQFCSADAVE